MRIPAVPRLGDMNPLRLLPGTKSYTYDKLPTTEGRHASPRSNSISLKNYRWRSPSPGKPRLPFVKMSLSRFLMLAITTVLCLGLMAVGGYRRHHRGLPPPPPRDEYPWEKFQRLNGFYSGVRRLVSPSRWMSEQEFLAQPEEQRQYEDPSNVYVYPPMDPVVYNPYPEYDTYEYLHEHHPVRKCYLDRDEKISPPDIYAYPGVPQNMTAPYMGSHKELGLNDGVCFERYGRLGVYGYGYGYNEGGYGLDDKSDSAGADKVWKVASKVDYRLVDWGEAMDKCYEKNKLRFDPNALNEDGSTPDRSKKLLKRSAYVLRLWTGYNWDEHQVLSLRAMINELSLKSGGEYDVHFLVHVKDDSIPIWTSEEVYERTLKENIPEEFWSISTLWSEQQMRLYYPEPFPDNFVNPSDQPVHSVYRSAHFAIQWFAQQHQEYEYFWNWEMDLRLTGHYYEFHEKIADWAKKQPRKGLWERNSRFYIPERHGSWKNFTELVEEESFADNAKHVWGPAKFPNSGMLASPEDCTPPRTYLKDNYEWGVGEEADLITFNPIFDTEKTNWVFKDDVNGYDRSLQIPPRRAAIITVARLSKRLLNLAHEETWRMRHTMFPEMWPPSVALHHGLKAVYAPHPVYFDRQWDMEYLDQVFNHPSSEENSPFGWGEHNFQGSSFYYNAGFSGALWRRWFGYKENGEGGTQFERTGTGRMCLKSTLFHPIKFERGPAD